MKRWTAAALSATMIIGVFPVAAMAEEVPAAATASEISFKLSGENDESMEAVIMAVEGQDGSVSVSAGFSMSAALAGTEEPMEIVLEDILRVADGTAYINAESILNMYQETVGDASLTMLATMAGINQPWIEIPALDVMVEDTTPVIPEISEEFATALTECFAGFEVVETEDELQVPFDGTDVVSVIKSLKNIGTTYAEEIAELITSSASSSESIDYKEVFADYILAAAEGMSAVDSTITVDEALEELNTYLDLYVQMETEVVAPEMIVSMLTDETLGFDETIAEMEAALTADTLNGALSITETGLIMEININDEYESMTMELSFLTDIEGDYPEITVPVDTVLLRDVVKNVAIIYYSSLTMEESLTEAQ